MKTKLSVLLTDFKNNTTGILNTKQELNLILDQARAVGLEQTTPWSRAELLSQLDYFLKASLPNPERVMEDAHGILINTNLLDSFMLHTESLARSANFLQGALNILNNLPVN